MICRIQLRHLSNLFQRACILLQQNKPIRFFEMERYCFDLLVQILHVGLIALLGCFFCFFLKCVNALRE